ncbi:uncharacterized protein TNCV_5045671 [Trichonephila clavipes]|uniref:Uncharacterized protein n=1 Tax=Trichonephila clavipes TaxID=2585209 RepID=A0A8X7BL53_TRICX|nr:uncharacterized protein TNCV_5045671 [Trichonephila clavipes]
MKLPVRLINATNEQRLNQGPETTPLRMKGDLEDVSRGYRSFALPSAVWGCGSPVGKVSDYGRHGMSSSPVPLKTRRVGQRCTLNLSRAETSSRGCGVVVRRGGASSGVVHVT